jgi:hypothetical protein
MKASAAAKTGFSLIESLIALTFLLLIILSSIEFFGSARKLFFKLQGAQLDQESALAALEKIKEDILLAGQGLVPIMRLDLIKGIGTEAGTLLLKSRSKTAGLSEDARAGRTAIDVVGAEDFSTGRSVYLCDSGKGESLAIASADGNRLFLSGPLAHDYLKEESSVVQIQEISYYLDVERATLRRKVNSGIAQPVLEDVQTFAAGLDGSGRLVTAGFRIRSRPETPYEIAVVPKNLAMRKSL